ncbi:MAG: EcsC family protein [Planctomycetaceae bacterium]|nr:EcsC family protein [Planctomycetaceae bacterium]
MESSALMPYEADQVAQIAAWKARKPRFLGRTLDTLRWPIDRLFERLVPSSRAYAMLKRVHQAADWSHGRDVIQQALGIENLAELRAGPLERCDGLVKKVRNISREMITSESLLANAGGLATELLQLPAEIMLALRTVHRVAACYGYTIDLDQDETLVMAIIGMSLLDEPQERQRARHLIRELEDRTCPKEDAERLVSATSARLEDDLGEELAGTVGSALLEQKIEEGIPFIGAAIGVVVDNAFLSGVEEAAQRTFQERWLRDHGKVDEIAPAELPASTTSLSAGVSQAAYSTSYAISFGVVFPAALVAQAGADILPTPIYEGFKAGATAASRDAYRLLAGVRGQPDPAPATAS